MQTYSEFFYKNIEESSLRSAKEIIPLVQELIQAKSVIDVGCGTGTWLSVFMEMGVSKILGLDGSYVNPNTLHIPKDKFLVTNLTEPLKVLYEYDLAISLEVAEHLPAESANIFIDSLTKLAPVILFSSAIPFQGGINHINEQWPGYWETKFLEKNYIAIDCLRRKFLQNSNIEWWYSQNIVIYVKSDKLDAYPKLDMEYQTCPKGSILPLIHPQKYMEVIKQKQECEEQLWADRIQLMKLKIKQCIPEIASLVLVDEGLLPNDIFAGYCKAYFIEQDGHYWGSPVDDGEAINQLKRLREQGYHYLIFAWPAFWWFKYYSKLTNYIESNFNSIFKNHYMVIFDISTADKKNINLSKLTDTGINSFLIRNR